MWTNKHGRWSRRLFATTKRTLSLPSLSDKPFDKILIANRGEIACRVIRTARRLGVRTVAIYSEADAQALHVRMADEAFCVGPPPSAESYLNIAEIMRVIQESKAQAVHPGYGFLSENFKFCEELTRAGIEFIGPSVDSIRQMGDKIESKLIAKAAGVHTIPGFDGVVEDVEHAIRIAQDIGYPVMIKASAGGGGKGMRIAWNEEEVRENFAIAATESKASFGDDRLLVEKFIEQPRHIEIQLIGDKHGNIVYLPERECSIQRRNQKVIEEAPSMALDPDTRRRMGEQAVQLARQVGYFSAGTVEFLLDKHRNFYFLEMNTRLQVEHPITEYVTGLDLVELMLRVASGQPLGLTQADVQLRGWAIEGRVYAEDPKLYLPCIGRLSRYVEPDGEDGAVRCDTGIVEGSDISIYYDPLICKLSAFGATRAEALATMERALDSYVIKGVTHNIPLLREVVSHPSFVAGDITTRFLAEHFPMGFDGHQLTADEHDALVAIAVTMHVKSEGMLMSGRTAPRTSFHVRVGESPSGESPSGESSSHVTVVDGEVTVDGRAVRLTRTEWNGMDPLWRGEVNGRMLTVQLVNRTALGFDLRLMGTVYAVQVLTDAERACARHMKPRKRDEAASAVLSPMPGRIVSVAVRPGETVRQGGELLVIEAMKMQNVMRASRAGRIKTVRVRAGESVATDDVLVEFAEEAGAESAEK